MKTCPKCGELLGDGVEVCFHCQYSYKEKRVITDEERQRKREQQDLRKEQREIQLANNPLFEYKVVVVNDFSNGEIDWNEVQGVLSDYAGEGWRLHSIFANEIGKKGLKFSSSGFVGEAAIEQTVLVFERCIKA